jgi:hypothetical protein
MIDDTAFSEAAWHCDDQVAIPDGNGGTTLQARYTCDGVLNVDQSALDNLRALLTSCRGFLVFSGGKYKLKIDRDETVPGASFGYDFTGGAARQFAGGAGHAAHGDARGQHGDASEQHGSDRGRSPPIPLASITTH